MINVRRNAELAKIRLINKLVIAAVAEVESVDGLQQEIGFAEKSATPIAAIRIQNPPTHPPNHPPNHPPTHLLSANQAARRGRVKVKEVGKKGKRAAKSILITTTTMTMTMTMITKGKRVAKNILITTMITITIMTMITTMTMTMSITEKKEKECYDQKAFEKHHIIYITCYHVDSSEHIFHESKGRVDICRPMIFFVCIL